MKFKVINTKLTLFINLLTKQHDHELKNHSTTHLPKTQLLNGFLLHFKKCIELR